MKIQIYTSYYIGNIRQQNGFVFYMHAKQLQNSQLNSYLVDLFYIAIGILKILHEQLTTCIVMTWLLVVNQKQTLLLVSFTHGHNVIMHSLAAYTQRISLIQPRTGLYIYIYIYMHVYIWKQVDILISKNQVPQILAMLCIIYIAIVQ